MSAGTAKAVFNICTTQEWVASFTLRLLYPRNSGRYPKNQTSGRSQSVWTILKRDCLLLLQPIWRLLSCLVHSLLAVIPTELSRLLVLLLLYHFLFAKACLLKYTFLIWHTVVGFWEIHSIAIYFIFELKLYFISRGTNFLNLSPKMHTPRSSGSFIIAIKENLEGKMFHGR